MVSDWVFVSQEYVEFFCSPWDLSILLEVLNKDEFKFVSYMAVNSKVCYLIGASFCCLWRNTT